MPQSETPKVVPGLKVTKNRKHEKQASRKRRKMAKRSRQINRRRAG